MKKYISLFLCVLCVLTLFSCSKTREKNILKPSEYVDTAMTDNYVLDIYEDYVEVVDYTGEDEELVIIDEYDSLPVKSIGDYAFKDNLKLKSVTIPSSVLKIGQYAFSKCKNIESIEIGKNVSQICNNAFESCKSLKSIVIPSSVVDLGAVAFLMCEELEKVSIPDQLDNIGAGVFAYTTWLDSFEDEFVFAGDNVLIDYKGDDTEVSLPEKTKHVSAFFEKFELKKVVFNKGLKTVGDMCFSDCGELEEVVFSDTVETIGEKAFVWCQSLKKLDIPSSVVTIEDEAFSDCVGFTEFTVASGVRNVGLNAFRRCESLKDIYFENSDLHLEYKLFGNEGKAVTLHAKAGSAIEEYCKKQGFKFESID